MTWLPLMTLAVSLIFLLATGGGLFPWTLCVTAALTTCAHLACERSEKDPTTHRTREIQAVYVAVLAFLVLTLLPFPAPLTIVSGKLRHDQNRRVVQAVDEAADLELLPAKSTRFSLTRNRAGTLRATMLIVACFSCIFLASRLTQTQRSGFLYALCILGGAIAAAGYVALRLKPQGDTLWWTIPIPHGLPGPLLCFVNRNHFAGYLAMLCPASLALFFAAVSRRTFFPALLCIGTFAAMTVAIILTLSRGAVVAYAGGYVVLIAIYLIRRCWINASSLVIAVCAVATAMVFLHNPGRLFHYRHFERVAPAQSSSVGNSRFTERMEALRNPVSSGEFKERIDAWKTCFTIWRSYPIAGAGLNAFRMVFPQHRTTSRREFMVHPENEYAQLPAESGLIGTMLFILFLVAVFRCRGKGVNASSAPEVSAAVIAALATAAIHACFDFAPHLPVYAITVSTMLGFLLAPPDQYPTLPFAAPPALNRQTLPSILAILLVCILSLQAGNMARLDSPARMADLDLRQLSRSLEWSPVSWQAWFYFGRECCRDSRRESKLLGERCVTRATELDPNNYLLWRELGHLRLKLGMTDAARKAFARAKELRYWLDVPEIPPGKSQS